MKKNKIKIYSIVLLLLASCNNATNNSYIEPTIVKNEKISSNVSYSGEKRNNEFDGVGTLTYSNKYELTGTFKNNKLDESQNVHIKYLNNQDQFVGNILLDDSYEISLVYGTYTKKSNSYKYTGKFKDNLLDDENGSLTIPSIGTYKGAFEKGSNIDKIGTLYFNSYETNAVGMHYFTGKMKNESSFYDNQEGNGSIKYDDHSTYTGNMIYTNGGYFRKGYGEMDFQTCYFLGSVAGGDSNTRLYKYVGEFDYSISGWMYGDGIMYYVDIETNKPKYYQKGKWYGLSMVGKYSKNDYELLDGFSKEMESEYIFNQPYVNNYINRYYSQSITHKAVVCGDSYTDMMHASYNIVNFEEEFPHSYDIIDTGIGATTYYQWLNYAKHLIIPYKPEKIFLHLGFNDLHMGLTPNEVINYASELVNLLKEELPNSMIYLMSVEPSPEFSRYLNVEIQYNKLLKEYCNKNNIKLLDNAKNFYKNETETIDDLSTYFISDRVHMNKKGYEKFIKLIKDEL